MSVSSDNKMHSSVRRPSNNLQSYSGNDHGSYSDFSDTGFFPDSSLSLPRRSAENRDPNAADTIYKADRPAVNRNISVVSASEAAKPTDEERVIYHGWLYLLKTRRGMRQWKSLWCVLRPKSFILYKNEDEYSALLILPFPQIVNAVEIDAQSKSKKHCFQIITEERNWRFCAMGEEELAKWLGALKSLLARRKEKEFWEKEEERLKERPVKEKGKGVELRDVGFATAGGGKGTAPTTAPVVTNATNQQQALPLR
jgi:PH domain